MGLLGLIETSGEENVSTREEPLDALGPFGNGGACLKLLLKFAEDCAEVAVMDKEPKLEGRHMNMFLSPKVSKDTKEATK